MELQAPYRIPGPPDADSNEQHPQFAVLYLRVDPRLKADLENEAHVRRQSCNRFATELLIGAMRQRIEEVAAGEDAAEDLHGPTDLVELNECPGHAQGGRGDPCCDRVGEYNGFASGPTTFQCPRNCSCHD